MRKKYYDENNFYEHLGELIRDKRKDADINQEELAKAINISRRQLMRFEKGESKLKYDKLLKIMFLLKMTGILSIFKQVKEFNDFDYLLGTNSTDVQKEIIKKVWNM